jgi:hypothetical protein
LKIIGHGNPGNNLESSFKASNCRMIVNNELGGFGRKLSWFNGGIILEFA